jgi:catechol-2,3-dioxygenase
MRIDEVRLPAGDLLAQRRFYAERLGLPVAESAPDALALRVGASRLAFAATPAGQPGAHHLAFTVPENQLAEAKAWLAARTPLVRDRAGRDEFHFAAWDAHAIYCRDPAGNLVELIARHALPNATGRPFGAASLLAISEVGLAVDDVPGSAARLRAALGVAAYAGPGGEEFAAIGDEHGLLNVIRRGRGWLGGAGGVAAALPLTVALTDGAGRRRTLSGPPYVVAG